MNVPQAFFIEDPDGTRHVYTTYRVYTIHPDGTRESNPTPVGAVLADLCKTILNRFRSHP